MHRDPFSCCDSLLRVSLPLFPASPCPSAPLDCTDVMLWDRSSIPNHPLFAAAFLSAPIQLLPYQMAASQVQPVEDWCPPAVELNHDLASPVVVHQLCLANVACTRGKAALKPNCNCC